MINGAGWKVIQARIDKILSQAEDERRDLLPHESGEIDSLNSMLDNQEITTSDGRRIRIARPTDRVGFTQAAYDGDGLTTTAQPKSAWITNDGRPIHVLNKGDRWADLPGHSHDHGIGYAIKAIAQGHFRGVPDSIQNALSGGSNPAGGVLVPSQLLGNLIDKARAMSVVAQLGAQTVVMDTDRTTIARVSADPSFEVKSENAAFSGSDITFDAVSLTAHTIGQVVTASRELAEDAPNFAQAVEDTLARALAAEIDRQFLVGTSSQELSGLIYNAAAGATGSVGAIAWEDLATAVVDIWGNNYQPNGYVASPTIMGDLLALTSGDGSTSAKLWLGPPAHVAELQAMKSSNMLDTSIAVGDFTKALIGLRHEARIEVSTEAGNAFEKHQMLIKIVWRGDFNLADASAFHILNGITT